MAAQAGHYLPKHAGSASPVNGACRHVCLVLKALQYNPQPKLLGGQFVKLVLAPMEGLADDVLRATLTSAARYDWAVSEFVRVTGTLLPERSFQRLCPELLRRGQTASGTPLRVQLLGSDVESLARNAARVAALGAPGVDLNFGCPAPTVNRHRGGAVLLEEPELLFAIVRAVRSAVPSQIPCSAKMRLGVSNPGKALECAHALVEGGAGLLTVHARTKAQGYQPPAHWEWVARIAQAVPVPVVANGEVWSVNDWLRCREISGVDDVMLGRGAVADPFLARAIRRGERICPDEVWPELALGIAEFWSGVQRKVAPLHAPGRLKQWLRLLGRAHPRARALFVRLRAESCVQRIGSELIAAGIQAPAVAA